MKRKENADQISGGVFLVGLGLLFLTGWWWPGIMFVIGASIIARTVAEGQRWQDATAAFWVIGIGVVFSIPNLFGSINWGMLWPLLLIGIGLFMLFGGKFRPQIRYGEKSKNDDDTV